MYNSAQFSIYTSAHVSRNHQVRRIYTVEKVIRMSAVCVRLFSVCNQSTSYPIIDYLMFLHCQQQQQLLQSSVQRRADSFESRPRFSEHVSIIALHADRKLIWARQCRVLDSDVGRILFCNIHSFSRAIVTSYRFTTPCFFCALRSCSRVLVLNFLADFIA